jgi:hypothetical protein
LGATWERDDERATFLDGAPTLSNGYGIR